MLIDSYDGFITKDNEFLYVKTKLHLQRTWSKVTHVRLTYINRSHTSSSFYKLTTLLRMKFVTYR